MLTFTEIRQLSDRDLVDELKTTRDALFRQKIGVRTAHLKDNHMIAILKKYIAQIITEINRRRITGEKIAKTDSSVAKKVAEIKAELIKTQVDKKSSKAKAEVQAIESTSIESDSTDIKVKKVAKKSFLNLTKKK